MPPHSNLKTCLQRSHWLMGADSKDPKLQVNMGRNQRVGGYTLWHTIMFPRVTSSVAQ